MESKRKGQSWIFEERMAELLKTDLKRSLKEFENFIPNRMKTQDTHKNRYIQDRHIHKQTRERGNSQTAEIKGKKRHMALKGATLKIMLDFTTKIWNPEGNGIHI